MNELRNVVNFKKSEKYRSRIHDLIPGGCHTYSRGDDQFPQRSPAAFKRGSGSQVWDLDENQYLDFPMGLTSVSLGHAYPAVIERVSAELQQGSSFQRPSYLEEQMAEAFLELLPQHEMIKFAKNGSTVTTAAVKIARAATGRSLVAFPGDHPFYSYDDWFIGKTPCNLGVPEEVQALSLTFRGCDIDSLKALFLAHPGQIACVITEPERSTCGPDCFCHGNAAGFLLAAIELCRREGAVFILDEMITGFKTAFPGSLSRYNLRPDLATWGKGIANGFSFCALTGIKELMELGGIRREGAEKLFLISSTHGGESHSIAAALATLGEFKRQDVVAHNQSIGRSFVKRAKALISSHGLADYIEVTDCPWMPLMIFRDAHRSLSQGYRTLAMQEMIARGVLFQGSLAPCLSHTEADMDYAQAALDQTLQVYSQALQDGYQKFLVGEPAKPVFRKYL